jgi:hypothetical protein
MVSVRSSSGADSDPTSWIRSTVSVELGRDRGLSATGTSDVPAHTMATRPARPERAPFHRQRAASWKGRVGRRCEARARGVVLVTSAFACGRDRVHDGRDLLRRLARAEHGFGKASPERAVVVDLGEAEVLVGEVSKTIGGRFRGDRPGLDVVEQAPQALRVH